MEINNTPAELNIRFVSGDDFSLSIVSTGSIDTSTFAARILDEKFNIVSTFTITTVSTSYTAILSLTDTATAILLGDYSWYFERTDGTDTRTLISGSCEVIRK